MTDSRAASIGRSRWEAFAVCVTATSLTILDITKVNVALPAIEQALGAGPIELQLVVSTYILAFGLALVPAGRLGDQRSRRALLLIGVALFAVASIVCAIAPNVWVLVAGRILQGVAGGVLVPQVMGLTQTLFIGEERGRAFGLFGAIIGLSTAFGPALGGLLIAIGGEQDGWRLVFWMNVPLFGALLFFAWRLIPHNVTSGSGSISFDPVGLLIFAIAVISLLMPFLLTTGSADDSPLRWLTLIVFVIAIWLFLAWERAYAKRGHHPLIELSMFRITSFRYGSIIMAFYFMGMPALFLLSTLFLQSGLGLSALAAGLTTIGFALSSAVTAWIGGRLVIRFGRPVVLVGLVIMVVTVVALILVALYVPTEFVPWALAVVFVIGGAGGGFVISPNQTLTVADIPPAEGGAAGSIGQLGQRIGNAIGVSIAISIFYATIYREEGSAPRDVVYHDAFAFGLMGVAGCFAAALVVAVLDVLARRKNAQAPEMT